MDYKMMSMQNGPKGVDAREGKLLLESSESDTEHFSLPPLELKGSKRRKRTQAEPDCCASRSCFIAIGMLILIALVAGLAVFTYLLKLEVAQIKEKTKSEENVQGSEDDNIASFTVASWPNNPRSSRYTRHQDFYLSVKNKLDPSGKLNVDFKPSKKMKKRRELDALVNGKQGRRKKKNGQHELLRNDSESSEIEEFSIPQKAIVRNRRGPSRFCATCIPVCGFFMLTACIVAIGGLVWVHIELRNELDLLRTKLNKVESGSQDNPEEFQKLHTKHQELEDKIAKLKDGPDSFTQKIKMLSDETQGAKQDIATLGNKIEENLNKVSELTNRVEALEKGQTVSSTDEEKSSEVRQTGVQSNEEFNKQVVGELAKMKDIVDSVNSSLALKITNMKLLSDKFLLDIGQLGNRTTQLEDRLNILELSTVTGAPDVGHQDKLNEIVLDAVHAVLKNLSDSEALPGAGVEGKLDAKVQNISMIVESLQKQILMLPAQDGPSDILTSLLMGNIQALNGTITANSESLEVLDKKLENHDQRLNILETNRGSQSTSTTTTSSTSTTFSSNPTENKVIPDQNPPTFPPFGFQPSSTPEPQREQSAIPNQPSPGEKDENSDYNFQDLEPSENENMNTGSIQQVTAVNEDFVNQGGTTGAPSAEENDQTTQPPLEDNNQSTLPPSDTDYGFEDKVDDNYGTGEDYYNYGSKFDSDQNSGNSMAHSSVYDNQNTNGGQDYGYNYQSPTEPPKRSILKDNLQKWRDSFGMKGVNISSSTASLLNKITSTTSMPNNGSTTTTNSPDIVTTTTKETGDFNPFSKDGGPEEDTKRSVRDSDVDGLLSALEKELEP